MIAGRASRGVRAHFQPVESILRMPVVVTLIPNPPPAVMMLRGLRFVRLGRRVAPGRWPTAYYVER